MQIDYRIGDMFKGGHKYIAHGCNARGVMGSGVAKIVKDKYYYAYLAYVEHFEAYGLKMGVVIPAAVSHNQDEVKPKIFNCITQDHYGTDQRYANYGAIQSCMQWLDSYFNFVPKYGFDYRQNPRPILAMPMIGAGLAGGDWGIISRIIEQNSNNFQPIVYDFTP